MKLSYNDLRKVADLWLNKWHENPTREGGNTELWWDTFMGFFESEGWEVVTAELRMREARAIEQGLSQEYMAALADVVDTTHARTEYDKAVLILTASPQERAKALDLIFLGVVA